MLGNLSEECLKSLVGVGLLQPSAKGNRASRPGVEAALTLFQPLLETFPIRLVPMEPRGCPIRFCTAIAHRVSGDTGKGVDLSNAIPAGGQGDERTDAAISCIGELAERLSLFVDGADDPRLSGLDPNLTDVPLGPCLGYSRSQEQALMARFPLEDDHERSAKIPWNALSTQRVCVEHLFRKDRAQLPAYGALFGLAGLSGQGLVRGAATTGAAVWRDRGGALERALLELVERDAIAQAWYNRLGIRRFDSGDLARLAGKKLFTFLSSRSRGWACLAIETDLPCHVVMAVSFSAGGRMAAFGASAGWDLAGTVGAAAREMLQSENALGLMERSYPDSDAADQDCVTLPPALSYARSRSVLEDLAIEVLPSSGTGEGAARFDLERMLAALEAGNIDIWSFDATHPDLKIPCIKLFSPQLCDWRPRFGKRRLFQGVVDRGHRSHVASEAEFAARPVPV